MAHRGCTIIIDSWCSLGLRVAAYVSDQWEVACTASEISAEEFPLRVLMEEVEQARISLPSTCQLPEPLLLLSFPFSTSCVPSPFERSRSTFLPLRIPFCLLTSSFLSPAPHSTPDFAPTTAFSTFIICLSSSPLSGRFAVSLLSGEKWSYDRGRPHAPRASPSKGDAIRTHLFKPLSSITRAQHRLATLSHHWLGFFDQTSHSLP